MTYQAESYDIAVVGAGHAGIEAGLAAARMGLKTVVFTINLDAVGNMPCNPAIGGTGKGQLVRELDALGGEMGKAADRCCIQYRMLGLGKGPAVHSLRAQADRRRYQEDMKRITDEIAEARKQADVVFVSFHGHETDGEDTTVPAMFLETFSRACIDAGAHAVIGHGPHELRGIEIYKGGLILYSLGNFLFETETVSLQPYDAYINRKMPLDTKVGSYMDNRSKNGTVGYGVLENIWRAVMAAWDMEDGKITQVQLYPITLGLHDKRPHKGLPRMSGSEETLRYLQQLSEPYGTKIRIENGVGSIDL